MKETLPEIIKRHYGLIVHGSKLEATMGETTLEVRCYFRQLDHTVFLPRGSLEPYGFKVVYDKFKALYGPTQCNPNYIELSLFLNPGKETDEILESLKS